MQDSNENLTEKKNTFIKSITKTFKVVLGFILAIPILPMFWLSTFIKRRQKDDDTLVDWDI